MNSTRKLLVGSMTAAIALGGGAIALGAGENVPPQPPPGVDANGTGDISELPEMMPVSGSDGEIVGYADRDELFGVDAPILDGGARLPVVVVDDEGSRVGVMIPGEGFVAD
jgi:hypothetical protein